MFYILQFVPIQFSDGSSRELSSVEISDSGKFAWVVNLLGCPVPLQVEWEGTRHDVQVPASNWDQGESDVWPASYPKETVLYFVSPEHKEAQPRRRDFVVYEEGLVITARCFGTA